MRLHGSASGDHTTKGGKMDTFSAMMLIILATFVTWMAAIYD